MRRVSFLFLLTLMSCPSKDENDPLPEFPDFLPFTIEVIEGKTLSIKAEPNPGWKFDVWMINDLEYSNNPDTVYVMPSENVTITAMFSKE